MATSSPDPARVTKLTAFFKKIIHGQKPLSNKREGLLFIESVCLQPDAAVCAQSLSSGPQGRAALQASVRFDTSLSFLNGEAVDLIRYFQEPVLQAIESGTFLAGLLLNIVDPPFFWEALIRSFSAGTLSNSASQAFAWLLLQLLSLPNGASKPYLAIAKSPDILKAILESSDGLTRNIGQKIKHSLPLEASEINNDAEERPGGRHDNDFADYRQISIMPTADELLSKDRAYFQMSNCIEDPKTVSLRTSIHLGNQFRLLREDMQGDIREEMKVLSGDTNKRHRGIVLNNLCVAGLDVGRYPWGIIFVCPEELPLLKGIYPKRREKYLKDNRHILRHNNMACLLVDDEPVAFPTINRKEDELVKKRAEITVQFLDESTMINALLKVKTSRNIKLAQLDAAVFAYEPFLKRLQEIKALPLSEEILHWSPEANVQSPSFSPSSVIRSLQSRVGKDLKDMLGLQRSAVLDQSQMSSLCACLLQRVSLVQGPPGTGKSFVGALVAKVIHDSTKQKILVVCFTNHALDQFLEDLMDIGIPQTEMVRLGGKSTSRTECLKLRDSNAKLSVPQRKRLDNLDTRMEKHQTRLKTAFKRYQNMNVVKKDLMDYLEFLSDDRPFFDAFTLPQESGGMKLVGKKGKAISPFYLLDRWLIGCLDSGTFKDKRAEEHAEIWAMPREPRDAAVAQWRKDIMAEVVTEVHDAGREYNRDLSERDRILKERDATSLKDKRIIACTTNGAAKYAGSIQAAGAGVVLVEEAGEILESHILTAMGSSTEQLIMVGDHQQLRPKCSYELSVEQGDGFDLNRSLFERLILKGFPHETLSTQHRMRPEISSMIRTLTYPELVDADSTLVRPNIRGFRDDVLFVNHSHPETELKEGRELREGKTSSKQNLFEASMILKCTRYLAQQGYESEQLVILTPYLGQLKLLRDQLSKENDPVLNELDQGDLFRAGLMTSRDSSNARPKLRISTIDNYQGEESDIVLVSMTRSNNRGDIGFMAAPERLNVMLSRARNGLIVVGNSTTFLNARKGREIWTKLFEHLKGNNHFYEGIPVKCVRHPDRVALLNNPEAFEIHVPDGGCAEPCGQMLNCGRHPCIRKCHKRSDHAKIKCFATDNKKCDVGHPQSWQCHEGAPKSCRVCEREKKEAIRKAQKDYEEKKRKQEKADAHRAKIAKIDEELEKIHEEMRDLKLDTQQGAVLVQKKADLAEARRRAEETRRSPPAPTPVVPSLPPPQQNSNTPRAQPVNAHDKSVGQTTKSPQEATATRHNPISKLRDHIQEAVDHNKSEAGTLWQRQKDQENARNEGIDKIMEMTGLENVKSQVLRIKAKVETSIRQGTDLSKERLGVLLLGNPGTGKTTVARHYAKTLTTLGILPGDAFVETTGSRLSSGGVPQVQKHLDELDKAGGGVYFIDEAYQLTEGNSFGGKPVLDYLLAEIENLTGKVAFLFAGYRKQMESFIQFNPGLSSRIPYQMDFEDYTDSELLRMLQSQMSRLYQSGVDVEEGFSGLYMRIVIRRLGQGRGREGFGNARALENVFSRIRERQSDRIDRQRREGLLPDDFLLTKEDLIGPDPSIAIKTCHAWTKLQELTGLEAVKESVRSIIDLISTNYARELAGKEPVSMSLNRVFLGPPGTGKTSVAQLYGRILADMGMLSNGEVLVKNPADFIGSVIGASEANTKSILGASVGKVLVIDEAYMLYSGSGSGNAGGADVYKTAVIDTIVAEVQNVPGDDRCVLLLGYEDQMRDMFQHVNPGLARRFRLDDAFCFEDFNDSQLLDILNLKLRKQQLGASEVALTTAIEVLARQRNGLNFGNGGTVENLITTAKANFQSRQSKLPVGDRDSDFLFEPQDFDPNYNRAEKAETNLEKLFEGVLGCEAIISKLDGFLKVAKGMRARDMDPRGQIPMNFVFKGPPGTGKTTTARKFGQVYHDLGFLSQAEVVECSASDLVGQYVGQTGPKTRNQLDRGLGKVLFIDEAYRLSQGQFAQEAIDELVDCVTKPKYLGKLVIILAGYEDDMNKLLRVNEGLISRFAEEITFPSLGPALCLQILESSLKKSQIVFPAMQDSSHHQKILEALTELCELRSWGNARDVQTLAKNMTQEVYCNITSPTDQLTVSPYIALRCVEKFLQERKARDTASSTNPLPPSLPVQSFDRSQQASRYETSTSAPARRSPPPTDTQEDRDRAQASSPAEADNVDLGRDPGVSDEIWAQLQADKQRALTSQQQNHEEILAQEAAEQVARQAAEQAAKEAAELAEREAKDRAEAIELLRKLEEARKSEEEAMKERERIRREIERIRKEWAEQQRKEEKAQAKLRQMGVCVAGFQWIKQTGGYCCAGGSHWVSDGQLGM